MADTTCACKALGKCAAQATQEDLLCDNCRWWQRDTGTIHISGQNQPKHQTLSGKITIDIGT